MYLTVALSNIANVFWLKFEFPYLGAVLMDNSLVVWNVKYVTKY